MQSAERKIGILTFQDSPNFGANLQAYALQEVIQELGYNVEIINYYSPARKYPKQSKLNRIRSIVWSKTAKKLLVSKIRSRKTAEFKSRYLKLSAQRYETPEQLQFIDQRYNVIVVGSDQVWNSHNLNGDDSFWLPFINQAKGVSYAPSFGKAQLDKNELKKIKVYLKKFSAISVREPSGAMLLSDLIPQKISVTLDPTFLLPVKRWNSISSARLINEDYILCYFMPGDKIVERTITNLAIQLSKITGKRIINIGKKEYSKLRHNADDRYDDGPLDFLSLIRNSTYVITNSFHGTVFSIIYGKPFWVPVHKNKKDGGGFNSRIVEMLDYLALQDRIKDVDSEDNIRSEELILNPKIYQECLKKKVTESIKYLREALQN